MTGASEPSIPVPPWWAANAKVDEVAYASLYARSLDEPETYWLEQTRRLDWIVAPTKADESSFARDSFDIRWFADGVLNVSANCLDRHLPTRGDSPAIIWEPDDPASRAPSPIASCTSRYAAARTCSRRPASAKVTASPSTCR